jgi:hypothetical protein
MLGLIMILYGVWLKKMGVEGKNTKLSTLSIVVGIISSAIGIVVTLLNQQPIRDFFGSWMGNLVVVLVAIVIISIALYYPVRLGLYLALKLVSIKKFAVKIVNSVVGHGKPVYFEIELETRIPLMDGFIELRISDSWKGMERTFPYIR